MEQNWNSTAAMREWTWKNTYYKSPKLAPANTFNVKPPFLPVVTPKKSRFSSIRPMSLKNLKFPNIRSSHAASYSLQCTPVATPISLQDITTRSQEHIVSFIKPGFVVTEIKES